MKRPFTFMVDADVFNKLSKIREQSGIPMATLIRKAIDGLIKDIDKNLIIELDLGDNDGE